MESATTAEENMEGKKVYVYEICGKECVSSRGLKRHDTLKHTREGTSKTEEKPKKTVLPTLQISQFEEIVKECAKLCHGDSCFFAWRHKKENSKVKNPFRRFWIRPVISSHVCEFMDDVFDKLKKACLTFRWSKFDSDALFRSRKLIPTFSQIWQGGNLKVREKKHSQPLAELKLCGIWLVCPNFTYIFMFARTVPVAYASNV